MRHNKPWYSCRSLYIGEGEGQTDIKVVEFAEECVHYTKIESLYIKQSIVYQLPPILSQFTRLKMIDVEGYFPPPMETIQLFPPSLVSLFLSVRQPADTVIPFCQSLTSLDVIVNGSSQSCILPDHLFQMTNLRTLSLAGAKVQSLPGMIGCLTQLHTLKIVFNEHKWQELPSEIGQLTRLRELTLSDCHISTLPESVTLLTNLTKCFIGTPVLCDNTPPYDRYLSTLRSICEENTIHWSTL